MSEILSKIFEVLPGKTGGKHIKEPIEIECKSGTVGTGQVIKMLFESITKEPLTKDNSHRVSIVEVPGEFSEMLLFDRFEIGSFNLKSENGVLIFKVILDDEKFDQDFLQTLEKLFSNIKLSIFL